jgi:Flp pilus assembly secretin CpaC
LNAIFQKGNARILSQPNISAVEGADAQITIGGTRPFRSPAQPAAARVR